MENTLNDCRTGKLHVQEGVCIIDFANELDFWMIKEVMIELCCNDKFVARCGNFRLSCDHLFIGISTRRKEHTLKEMQKAKNLEKVVEEEVEDFGDGYFAGAQQTLWDLFEKPQTSFLAKLLSLWSIG